MDGNEGGETKGRRGDYETLYTARPFKLDLPRTNIGAKSILGWSRVPTDSSSRMETLLADTMLGGFVVVSPVELKAHINSIQRTLARASRDAPMSKQSKARRIHSAAKGPRLKAGKNDIRNTIYAQS